MVVDLCVGAFLHLGEHALHVEDILVFFRSVSAELAQNILPIYCLENHLKESLFLLLPNISSFIFHAQCVDIL